MSKYIDAKNGTIQSYGCRDVKYNEASYQLRIFFKITKDSLFIT